MLRALALSLPRPIPHTQHNLIQAEQLTSPCLSFSPSRSLFPFFQTLTASFDSPPIPPSLPTPPYVQQQAAPSLTQVAVGDEAELEATELLNPFNAVGLGLGAVVAGAVFLQKKQSEVRE